MAGLLPKPITEFHKIPGARIAIIAAMWHPECVDAMVKRTMTELLATGVEAADISTHYLPGSLELPYAARCLFEKDPSLDAVIAFGVVLKGDTTHDDHVMQHVVNGFGRVSDRFHKPIINEVIGVNSLEDARKRSNDSIANKGVEAVFALTELLHWKSTL
ncbi:6,7-dimethyl-8-ribityllumazine synthase [Candidatus Endobugula sertula]|uniref:6,7-dimethyl-8-ribityllumazine synthase n=1 Tax=Candidatus Endobugula sertula TaxID=62101 RepID=A0A1D2QRT8_9GAMM|nr:6,7-dimethyl-8-ribityllumazine synthase [Candidatus Endobugula sertula]